MCSFIRLLIFGFFYVLTTLKDHKKLDFSLDFFRCCSIGMFIPICLQYFNDEDVYYSNSHFVIWYTLFFIFHILYCLGVFCSGTDCYFF